MTFKHDKLSNSPIFQQLQRIAVEKGLVKEDKIEKKASSNIIPTGELLENLVNLSSGLRSRGLDKHAAEIELAILKYKKAKSELDSNLLTNQSKAISNAEGDSLVESILDKHLAMMKAVEKLPTGKFAQNKSIINDVKKALGVASDMSQIIYQRKVRAAKKILQISTIIDEFEIELKQHSDMLGTIRIDTNIKEVRYDLKGCALDKVNSEKFLDSFKDLRTDLNDLRGDLNSWSDVDKERIRIIDKARGVCVSASGILTGDEDSEILEELEKVETAKPKYEDKIKEKEHDEAFLHAGQLDIQANKIKDFTAFNQSFINRYKPAADYLEFNKSKVLINKTDYNNQLEWISSKVSQVISFNTKLQSSQSFDPGDISALTTGTAFSSAKTYDVFKNLLTSIGSEIEKSYSRIKTYIGK